MSAVNTLNILLTIILNIYLIITNNSKKKINVVHESSYHLGDCISNTKINKNTKH